METVPIDRTWLVHQRSYLKYQLLQSESVGVWTAEVWTVENTSSDVDAPNLDYKRTNNIDIYIATMRITVVSFAFHHICVLNFNRWLSEGLWIKPIILDNYTQRCSILSCSLCLLPNAPQLSRSSEDHVGLIESPSVAGYLFTVGRKGTADQCSECRGKA